MAVSLTRSSGSTAHIVDLISVWSKHDKARFDCDLFVRIEVDDTAWICRDWFIIWFKDFTYQTTVRFSFFSVDWGTIPIFCKIPTLYDAGIVIQKNMSAMLKLLWMDRLIVIFRKVWKKKCRWLLLLMEITLLKQISIYHCRRRNQFIFLLLIACVFSNTSGILH